MARSLRTTQGQVAASLKLHLLSVSLEPWLVLLRARLQEERKPRPQDHLSSLSASHHLGGPESPNPEPTGKGRAFVFCHPNATWSLSCWVTGSGILSAVNLEKQETVRKVSPLLVQRIRL